MTVQTHEYELTIILRPDLDDADTYAIVEKIEGAITAGGAHLLERDDWGKRKLAYLIDKHQKGHYVLLNFLSEPQGILEVERIIRIEDRILRFLTVRVADAVNVADRVAEAEIANKRKAEEQARLEAERAAAEEAAKKAAAEANPTPSSAS